MRTFSHVLSDIIESAEGCTTLCAIMLGRAVLCIAPAVFVFISHTLAAQPAPDLRFVAPPALQAAGSNGSFAAPGMSEDATGFAWFATESGLVRFDGTEARTYHAAPGGLSSNLLYALVADSSGRLWIADGAGRLSRFDPLSGRADRVTFPVEGVRALYPALASDGTLWIGTVESGLFRLDAGHLGAHAIPLPGLDPAQSHGVIKVQVDSGGRVWIAAAQHGLFQVDARTGQIRRMDIPGTLLTTAFNYGVHVDRRGRTWVLTEQGLYRYESAPDRFTLVVAARDWPSLDAHAARRTLARRAADEGHRWIVDGYDRLWIASGETPGVTVLDLRTGRLARYHHHPGDPVSPSERPTIAFFEDRAGGVWVSSFNGVRRVAPPSGVFRHLALPTPDRGTRLALDRQGRLLAGVFCGATYRLQAGGSFERHPAFSGGLALCTLDSYEDAAGALWVATFASNGQNGLHRLGPNGAHARYAHSTRASASLPHSLLRVVHEDPKGQLWIGTEGGLARYVPGTDNFARVHTSDDAGAPFGHETIWTVTDAGGGALWVGTYEHGLVHYDPVTGHARRYRSDPADPHSLPSNIITAAVPSRAEPGIVWVGTYNGGLARLNLATGAALRYTMHEGLLSDHVRAVVEDRQGRIWASTTAGLVRLDPATGEFRTFTESDGLLSSAFALYAGLALPDGRLAFATPEYVVVFNPDATDLARVASPLALTALRVYDSERPIEAVPGAVHFAPDDDFFSFEYATLDFTSASQTRYRYWLEGFDRDWVEAGTRRAATYTNVPPGRYTLHIEANLGEERGTSALAVPVVVEAAWWEMLWVRLLGAVLAFGLVAGGVRAAFVQSIQRRLRQIEAQRALGEAVQRERTRISADVHDHLGAALTQIQLLSELSRRTRSILYAEKIAEAARIATQDLDAIVWAVNPAHDRLDAFADYLCAYTAEFCEAAGLRCRFERPETWPEVLLPAEVRYPAFGVLKEALCNAARHAHATTIRLRFLSSEGEVAVEIADDGVGFDPAGAGAFANGLQTMRQRAEAAGGRLEVESAPGEGTCLRLALRLRSPDVER